MTPADVLDAVEARFPAVLADSLPAWFQGKIRDLVTNAATAALARLVSDLRVETSGVVCVVDERSGGRVAD